MDRHTEKRSDKTSHYIVPSWVIPGTYTENLAFLEDKQHITGVELLFFIYDDETRQLFEQELPSIIAYRERFLFTAHLPDPFTEEHRGLIEKLMPLVKHCVVHPSRIEDARVQAEFLLRCFAEYGKERFLIENTREKRLEQLLSLLPDDTGICMDTGHLLIDNRSPLEHYKKYRGRIREIHLHGLDNEKAKLDGRLPDHRPLNADDPWLKELLPELKQFAGIINIEVFSWEETEKSLEVLI